MRNLLTCQRNARTYSDSIRATHSAKPNNTLPLCTVLFEIVDISTDKMIRFGLVPRFGDMPMTLSASRIIVYTPAPKFPILW